MYKTVARLISKSGCIIDAFYSTSLDEEAVKKQAIEEQHWTVTDTEFISIAKEWFEER